MQTINLYGIQVEHDEQPLGMFFPQESNMLSICFPSYAIINLGQLRALATRLPKEQFVEDLGK
ncbi:hypothetical protein A3K63_01275 [Candidatus Micrarchaeota archaeon RBG_16_49_10]|nr:MAG: hypothetical protein A3K63_01275 [Candidatus Micrarchaeota archaeon RBG_16_49_10]